MRPAPRQIGTSLLSEWPLVGVAIFTLLCTIAWVTFLSPDYLGSHAGASREGNSPIGCFQILCFERSSGEHGVFLV
jgi:hypothetical protein